MLTRKLYPLMQVGVAAVCLSTCLTLSALDLGDGSSETITTKAWEAYKAEKYEEAIAYARKCIEKYEAKAIEMQQGLSQPVPADDKDAVSSKWALNDVGTCYYIVGQASEKLQKPADAIAAYKQLVEKLPFAQCWDTKGWYWMPAPAAKARMKILEFEALE